MILAIAMMGFHIGYTAKSGNSDYFFLIPLGMGLLLVGMFLWFRWVLLQQKAEKEQESNND